MHSGQFWHTAFGHVNLRHAACPAQLAALEAKAAHPKAAADDLRNEAHPAQAGQMASDSWEQRAVTLRKTVYNCRLFLPFGSCLAAVQAPRLPGLLWLADKACGHAVGQTLGPML